MAFNGMIKDEKRDLKAEKAIVDDLYSRVKNYFSKEELVKRLEANGFNGVYLTDNEKYNEIRYGHSSFSGNSIGFYDGNEKAILMLKDSFKKNPSVGVHELGHALIDSSNFSILDYGEEKLCFGNGFEEGAVSALASNKSIDSLYCASIDSYPEDTILFLQLNYLYQKLIREYPNLLIHILKEKEEYVKLILEIQKRALRGVAELDLMRSSLQFISGMDLFAEEISDNGLYKILALMNLLCLAAVDYNVRNGNSYNPLFIKSKRYVMDAESKLLCAIFDDDSSYRGFLNRDLSILTSELILKSEELHRSLRK